MPDVSFRVRLFHIYPMNFLHIMTTTLALTAAAPQQSPAETPVIGKNEIQLKNDRMTPEALWAMGRIGGMTTSPDGKKIAYTVTYYSVQQNKSRTLIYLMNADGSDKQLFTQGNASEMEPQFLADGKHLAFLSTASGKPEVWQAALDGSDRKQLSFTKQGVQGFKFSPDNKQVILVQEVETTASIEKTYDDLPLTSGMVITDLNYKHWDHYVRTIPHIFLADFDGTRISDQTTDILNGEPYECPMLPFGGSEQFNWSPDSKTIVYTCRKKTGVDYAISTDSDIFAYEVSTGKTTNLCKPAGYQAPKTDPEPFAAAPGRKSECPGLQHGLRHQSAILSRRYESGLAEHGARRL